MLFTTQIIRKETVNLLLFLMFLLKMNNHVVLCSAENQPRYYARKITPVQNKEARDKGGLDLAYYKAANELDDKTKLRLILSTATSSKLKESAVFDPATIEALLANIFKNMSTFEHFSINAESLNVIMEYKRFNDVHADDLKKLHQYLSVEKNIEPLSEKSNFNGFLEHYFFTNRDHVRNVLDRLIEVYNLDASHARWKYLSASENAALLHFLTDKLFFEYKLENVENLTKEIKELVLKRPDPNNSDQLTAFFRNLRQNINMKCAENIKQTFKAVNDKIVKDEISFETGKKKKIKFKSTKLGESVKVFFAKAQAELTEKLQEALIQKTIFMIEYIGNDKKKLNDFDTKELENSYTTTFEAEKEAIFIKGSHNMIMESFLFNLTCANVCESLKNLDQNAEIEKSKLIDDFVNAADSNQVDNGLKTLQLDGINTKIFNEVIKKLQNGSNVQDKDERKQNLVDQMKLNKFIKNAIATIRDTVIPNHYSPLSQDEIQFIDDSLDDAIKELDVPKTIQEILQDLKKKDCMLEGNFIQLVCLGMPASTSNGVRSTQAAAQALAESQKSYRKVIQEVIKIFLTKIKEQLKILEANKEVLMKATAALDQYIKVEQRSFVIEKETDEIKSKFPKLFKNNEDQRIEFNKAFHNLVQQLEYTKNTYRTKATDEVPTEEDIEKTLSKLSKQDSAYKTHLIEVQNILINHFSKENLDARKKKLDTFLTLLASTDQEDKVYPESVIILEMINDLGNIGHENAIKIVEKMKIVLKDTPAVSKLDFEQIAAANGYKGETTEGKLETVQPPVEQKPDTEDKKQEQTTTQQPNPPVQETETAAEPATTKAPETGQKPTDTVKEETKPAESKYNAAFFILLGIIAIFASIIGITGYCIVKHHKSGTTQSI